MIEKEYFVDFFLNRGFLVSPDFLDNLSSTFNIDEFYDNLIQKVKAGPVVINHDLRLVISNINQNIEVVWGEFEKARVYFEKNKNKMMYSGFLDVLNYNLDEEKKAVFEEIEETDLLEEEHIIEKSNDQANMVVVWSYDDKIKKREVKDFVAYFKHRYNSLKRILLGREEMRNTSSINKVLIKEEKEPVSVIGLVVEKETTKNGNIMLSLEDTTGTIKALVNKGKDGTFNVAEDLILDEVIGITGVLGNRIIFCNEIFSPDIPVNHELKKTPDEAYAVFISDIHLGLKNFLQPDFLKMIKWLQGEYGDEEHRQIASKVKYLFIVGDLAEGVGVYPEQEKELVVCDIYEQYKKCAEVLSLVPNHIKIIVCPGNHDAVRLSEPQPPIGNDIAKELYNMKNVTMVSNPALINIHATSTFPGIDVLMYHGFSYIYYADNVPSIRASGGVHRCDLIMKFLLQKRHLSPSHTATLYIPDERYDSLVIEKVPDIFVSGHIHKSSVGMYKNVTTINCSCWTTQTEFQEKVGITPDPCKIPVINLKTREVRIMNFLTA